MHIANLSNPERRNRKQGILLMISLPSWFIKFAATSLLYSSQIRFLLGAFKNKIYIGDNGQKKDGTQLQTESLFVL